MTTPTVESYLEIIFMMASEGQPVIGARLADALHVSRPTVTATLRRMVRDGFVKLNDRKAIQLTPKGQALAEHLQRRHRVVERWLTDMLGFDWTRSDAEAHKLEHAMSDNGPISLKPGNRIVPISREVAQLVWVKHAR